MNLRQLQHHVQILVFIVVVASAAAADDLERRIPGTFERSYKPLIPRNASAPTLILLGAVEGPSALAPLARDAPYFPLALGPAWAGVPDARRVIYASRRKNRTETVAVGGFVEGWALGAIPPVHHAPGDLGGRGIFEHGAIGPRLGAVRRGRADDTAAARGRQRRRSDQYGHSIPLAARAPPPGDI